MKTLQVPRRFVAHEWGGTETTILQTSRALNQAGHPSQIFTSLALSEQREETLEDVRIRRFSYCYPFFGLSAQERDQMDRKGGNLLSLPLLWGLLREPGVELLHAHSGKRLGATVRSAARWRKIPYVISLHGGVFDVPQGEMQQMLEPIKDHPEWGKLFGALLGSRRVLADADAVIAVGENEAKAAAKALPHQRIEFLPNGVDSAAFAAQDDSAELAARFRQQYQIPQSRRIILGLSRIDYQKNQLALIEALPDILKAEPEAHVVLVGPVTVAGYHQRLLDSIQQHGLAAHVSIVPGLPPGDPLLFGAYHAAELFCLPSLHEPFGIVILEAWAAGLPVVAARVGGIPSFTKDGEDVLHTNPEDPARIASDITRVLTDADLATKLAQNGQVKAREQYDWARISERLLSIYQDVAQNRSRQRS